jgi:uncharacterized membrane protein
MALRFKIVTSNVVHVLVTAYVVVEINLLTRAIIRFQDKAEHGACSVEETLATVLIWGVLVASLLPGASINRLEFNGEIKIWQPIHSHLRFQIYNT